MNIDQILKKSGRLLKDETISNPYLEAELLLSFTLKKPREFLLAHGEKKVNKREIFQFSKYLKKRNIGMPLAYITGHKEFYGLDFIVNKHVLIPRPETELMVDEALKIIDTKNIKQEIFDIGTGSGCVIISIAKNTKYKNKIKTYAIDISAKVLTIAKKNARRHNLDKKINFVKSDLLPDNVIQTEKEKNPHILICANLPYLSSQQIKSSPSIKFEPNLALEAGSDGLKYYQKLFKQLKNYNLKKYNITLLAEIDPSQKTALSSLIKKLFPQAKFVFLKDSRGHLRLLKIKF